MVNIRQPSFIRDALGFIAGGILAAASAGLVFVAFIQLGDIYDGRNHVPEAFIFGVVFGVGPGILNHFHRRSVSRIPAPTPKRPRRRMARAERQPKMEDGRWKMAFGQ